MKMEQIVSSETSAIRTQTPGNYKKRNKLHLEHGESLKTRMSSKIVKNHILKSFALPLTSRYFCEFAAARHVAGHFKLSCSVTDKVTCVV